MFFDDFRQIIETRGCKAMDALLANGCMPVSRRSFNEEQQQHVPIARVRKQKPTMEPR